MDGYPYIEGSAGLREAVDWIELPEPVDEGSLANLLDGGNRAQLRLNGHRIHHKVTLHGDPLLPWKALHVLEDVLEFNGLEFRHLYLNAVRGAEPEVGAHKRPLVTHEGDPAVLGLYYFVT